jgi:diguanylate cyclase (GGDEF)-like protein/PAS domain S-box-containing protein
MATHGTLDPPAEDPGVLSEALAEARREAEALRLSLQRAQGALAAIADGVAVTDLEGHVTSLNPVATHLTGWTAPEALSRELIDVVRLVDASGVGVDTLRQGFRNRDDVMSLVRRDGHVILVDGSVSEIHDDARRPIGYIVTFRNVTAATRMARELSWHANHDALTGLLNRRVLEARLQRATATAGELACRHALLYLDLDRFKAINDSGGHVAGDELLRQLAMALRRQLREDDTLARIGGDEFAVLIENCTTEQAVSVARKLLDAVEAFHFAWQGFAYRLGASVGLVEFSGEGLDADDVLEAADRMCYVAKESGRGRFASDTLSALRTAPAKGRSARSGVQASARRS